MALPDLPQTGHDPVLIREVMEGLDLRPGMTVVDCTLGRGGHSHEIARRIAPDGRLIALDADPRNLAYARERLSPAGCEIRYFHANFAELEDVLEELEAGAVDRILADLGISTNQLFESGYGMSFSVDMPLDMRIDPRSRLTAADMVNKWPEERLANVLYNLAQERFSRQIARKIGEQRRISPITTTERLAHIVRSVCGRGRGRGSEKIDPATRTFLALRMAVNQELENLQALLDNAPGVLKPSGRLAVISFQSMEDRLVKVAFRSAEQTGTAKVLTSKPVGPSDEEMAANPRSRSAKLRVLERL